LNDADLQVLGNLLDRLGLGLSVSDAQGHVLLANRRGAVAGGESVELSEGRRITISGAAASPDATAPAVTAPAPLGRPEGTDAAPDTMHFEEALENEWRRARRERSALGLLMIQVDPLDVLLARHGQVVAERVVGRVDSVIRRTMRRAADAVMRVARGKFAVVLPNTAIQGAMDVAEIVRKAVVATDFHAVVPGGYPVTVSIGVAASVPLPGIVALSLVHGADAALAEAQRKGSNRVWMLQ
jgi:diguanylate cyclase (GGDEF)-like protein